MSRKIKAYVDCNEYHKIRYYQYFIVVDRYYIEDDEIVEKNKIQLDAQQGSEEVYDYDYYELVKLDDDGDPYYQYVCVEREQVYSA